MYESLPRQNLKQVKKIYRLAKIFFKFSKQTTNEQENEKKTFFFLFHMKHLFPPVSRMTSDLLLLLSDDRFYFVMLLQLPGPHLCTVAIGANLQKLPGVIAYFVRFHVRLIIQLLHAVVARLLVHARVDQQQVLGQRLFRRKALNVLT